MNSIQFFLIAAGFSLISWASSEGIVNRGYLPVVATVSQPRILQYPSYKPFYNQYQPYYPSYTSPYYPQYSTGYNGGYQQHYLGNQHLNTDTSLGLGALSGYYPNVNLDLITGVKPKVDVIDTVYNANGGYVYGKKK